VAKVVAGTIAEARDEEVLIERPDGSRINVIVNIRPLKSDCGAIIGAVNCFYDITARKEMEERLRDSDRRKTEFLAMLAHELRNPLAAILSSLAVVRSARTVGSSSSPNTEAPSQSRDESRSARTKPVDTAMDVLDRQVGQMVRLVDDLLDPGRISAGKLVLRRERIELSSVVYHALEAARPLWESLDQTLTVVLPEAPVYLNADATRLAQIVGNLLNNACKFSERGGYIWLTVEREEADGADVSEQASTRLPPNVVIRMRDTGQGIPADQRSRIFDLFTQVDTTRQRAATGLGIGLALVKTLTEMHGGTVDVISAGIGQGSEFIVRLPILENAAATPPTMTSNQVATVTALRVLIVDDNQDAADMLAMCLQLEGHETHTAGDGEEAIEATTRLQPDLVLLDIGLPRLNGYDAARRIREQHKQRSAPMLVALTGWGQDDDRRRSEEAGFDAHLVKPVSEAELRTMLVALGARKQQVKSN
jgi:two-component system, chemotaxis family, CheB/CheR fusion protein